MSYNTERSLVSHWSECACTNWGYKWWYKW